jgi:hypothetical protein
MGVGGVKSSHQIKVREAMDLVTFLTGFLNLRLRVLTTDFRSFETKNSVMSLFEKTQRVFDVRKDSQFIEPRAKTNENRHLPKHSHVFVANSFSSINCVTLLESRKLFESFRKDSERLK